MICFSKNGSLLTNDDIVKSPKNEIIITEKNMVQSIFRLEKEGNIPGLDWRLNSDIMLVWQNL